MTPDLQPLLDALNRIEAKLDTLAHDLQQVKTAQRGEKKREKRILKDMLRALPKTKPFTPSKKGR
jgi:hypothetical protein